MMGWQERIGDAQGGGQHGILSALPGRSAVGVKGDKGCGRGGPVGFFFLIIRRPPISTLFPYPPLFRSRCSQYRLHSPRPPPPAQATDKDTSSEFGGARPTR